MGIQTFGPMNRSLDRVETDVAIIGAGPAGAALAILLRHRGLDAIVVDRRGVSDCSAGETLPPNVAARLRRLGLWREFLTLDAAPLCGARAAWDDAEPHSFFGHMTGSGWVVDRCAFDALLRRGAVAAGARMEAPAHVTSVARRDGGWTIRVRARSADVEVASRFVVDATGRGAVCATRFGARRRRIDALVGLQWRLQGGSTAPEPPLIEATERGWWSTTTPPGGASIAMFLTDAATARVASGTVARKWPSMFLDGALLTSARWRRARQLGAMQVFPAFTHALEPAAGDNWIAVGDAAIGRDPISGSGVDFALASAELAAHVIARVCRGDRSATVAYAELIRRDFVAYLCDRRRVYGSVARWADAPFWRARSAPAPRESFACAAAALNGPQ